MALVGVPEDQIGAARRIAELSGARPVVAVNVEWEHAGDGGVTFRTSRGDGADKATADEVFANSFSVVYSYLPLAIQGLMGATQEGAVFKCVRGGAPEGSPWRILVKDDKGAYQQVGAMQRRPEQEDLESALYNAAAAQSPVNKAFEERELPRLKEERPGLKMSQYNEALSKMWKKDPTNPANFAPPGK